MTETELFHPPGKEAAMASGYYKEKEHAFITIEKDLKSGKIPEVILLCGKEDYL